MVPVLSFLILFHETYVHAATMVIAGAVAVAFVTPAVMQCSITMFDTNDVYILKGSSIHTFVNISNAEIRTCSKFVCFGFDHDVILSLKIKSFSVRIDYVKCLFDFTCNRMIEP